MSVSDQHHAGEHSEEACVRAWLVLREAHARVADCLRASLGGEGGLGLSEFEVLLALARAEPAPVRIGSLGPAVDLSQPAISRLVARLQRRGLVARARPVDDQRAVLISMTEVGAGVLRRAKPLHAACVREHLLDVAAEERTALLAILSRMG